MQLHHAARWFGLCLLLLVNSAHGATIPYQGNAFALGIQMGFASMQRTQPITITLSEDGSCSWTGTYPLVIDALRQARVQAKELTAHGYPLSADNFSPEAVSIDRYCFIPALEEIEYVRSKWSAELSNKSTPLAQAYNLGVNLGIAEGFSSTGAEVNRQVVYLSLQDALKTAQELKLDTTTLNECLLLAKGATPLSDIRSKLNSLRATYQAQM